MAYNYFVGEHPYLHSDGINFRLDLHTRLKDQGYDTPRNAIATLKDSIDKLEKMSQQLEREATSFLVDWNGDYKKASQEIFGEGRNNLDQIFRSDLDKILNSQTFISTIQKCTKVVIDMSQFNQLLAKYNQKMVLPQLSTENLNKSLDDLVDAFVEQIRQTNSKSTSKRVYIQNSLKPLLTDLLGKAEQEYFNNLDSLKKQVRSKLKKKTIFRDWDEIFTQIRKVFLLNYSGEKRLMAAEYYDKLKPELIKQGAKLKATDYSNITGFIAENLEATVINNSADLSYGKGQLEFALHVFDVGDLDEPQLIAHTESMAQKFNVPNTIVPMQHRNASGVQSGSDWIITNSHGQMVRAQVKNSVQIMEELKANSNHESGRPQPIKIQDTISYSTLKDNLQNYSGGGMSKEDWMLLDYLIVNVLWQRAKGGITKAKGADYSSTVSGVMEVINRIMVKEIGYFLGVAYDNADPEQAIKIIAGGSNIFFVLDNKILYPTYLLVDTIIRQLMGISAIMGKMHVSLAPIRYSLASGMEAEKEKEKLNSPNWNKKEGYGSGMLGIGRSYGRNILNHTIINRINLNLNIDEILYQVYEDAVKTL